MRWLLVALVAAVGLYLMTLGCGLVNYDDPWLVRDNYLLHNVSLGTLHSIFFDVSSPLARTGAEYLPIRDLSYVLDFAIWGERYAGFHLTNLVIYLGSIGVWFAALTTFGIDRKVAGLAIFFWAIHPSHAESVAWISERKGLLAMLFAGVCVLGYAHYRRGRDGRFLLLAGIATVFAVWRKATGAFAVASIAVFEVLLPDHRVGWKRSATGIAAIGAVALAAFLPVVMMATEAAVVGTDAPAGRFASMLGTHGFYLKTAAMATRNAVSYPIITDGPSTLELVLGGLGLVAMIGVLLPRWKLPREIRLGAALWLLGFLPASQLILPLQQVSVADRYLLFPTLGIALIVAAGVTRISRSALRNALLGVLVVAAALRTLDASLNWRNGRMLWSRAVASNPHDANAWSMYIEAVADVLPQDKVEALVAQALSHTSSPRLVMRQALVVLRADRTRGKALMREAAEAGDPIAMSNLALLLLDDRAVEEALIWARRGAALRLADAHAHRTHGKVALATGHATEALSAFTIALDREPTCTNQVNFALALVALKRAPEAIPLLDRCAADPVAGDVARRVRATLNAPPPPKPAGDALSVLVVLVDTVRADRFTPALMPKLDAFAKTATSFTRAYAQGCNTPRSVPSLFTSRMPSQIAFTKAFHNFPVVGDNEMLFEVLAARGLKTIFQTSHFYFDPRRGVGQGVAEYDNAGARTLVDSNHDYAAPRIVPRTISRLEQAARDRESFAMFVHLFEPHSTYIDHPDFPVTEKGEAGLVAKYDAEVRVVDRWLGQILDALDAQKLSDRTVVVVLSDHGEAFGLHKDPAGERAFFHGQTLYDEILRVPLVIRVPGMQPGVRDDLVALLDVAPTIVEVAGGVSPTSFVGRSLVPALRGQKLSPRPVLAEIQPTPDLDDEIRVYTDGKDKIIASKKRGIEIYDLVADPNETKNLADDRDRAARLRALVDKWTDNLR